jgi:hypothetical protein
MDVRTGGYRSPTPMSIIDELLDGVEKDLPGLRQGSSMTSDILRMDKVLELLALRVEELEVLGKLQSARIKKLEGARRTLL